MVLLASALVALQLVAAPRPGFRPEESPKHEVCDYTAEAIILPHAASLSVVVRCRYDSTTNQQGPLLLLMEYYVLHVEPTCPYSDGCTCLLAKVQEGPVVSQAERVYSVQVECVGAGLAHFPRLPNHTRTVDLSDNEVRSKCVLSPLSPPSPLSPTHAMRGLSGRTQSLLLLLLLSPPWNVGHALFARALMQWRKGTRTEKGGTSCRRA